MSPAKYKNAAEDLIARMLLPSLNSPGPDPFTRRNAPVQRGQPWGSDITSLKFPGLGRMIVPMSGWAVSG